MTLDILVDYLREKYHPKAILLHGSRARGDASDQSDYDFALITDNPHQLRPKYYAGESLDIMGISPTETILRSGTTPLWPCLVLFDSMERLGERVARSTQEAFQQGPSPLTKEERENRQNFSRRLINRIQNRGHDPMVRFYYMGDFYSRALRYWCELNQKWTLSTHLLLPLIASEDPLFYQALKELWSENYQTAVRKVHQYLFKEIL